MAYIYHYETSVQINATPVQVFEYVDNHKNLSSHMERGSLLLGGGSMETTIDEGNGKQINSHILLKGKVFGAHLYVDEVVTTYHPPYEKVWETVGNINLLIMGHYRMGVEVRPLDNVTVLKGYIDYNPPSKHKWLASLFAGIYSRWCVRLMLLGASRFFNSKTS